ncbi:MAG TPA: hypothetical protein VM124_03620 [Candidatus Limnocylindrales bacterium]|nr:hypothetical protein [Candidatus Limnocylindrales bacterium]
MLGFNGDPLLRASRSNGSIKHLVAATALALCANACSGSTTERLPEVVAQTAATGGIHQLPPGTQCPKGGHAYTGEHGSKGVNILMVPSDITDPNSAFFSVLIERSYDVEGVKDAVVCGQDASPQYGFGEAKFNSKALAAQKGFTAVITLS